MFHKRTRNLTVYRAIEFIVFMDDSLLGSQLFLTGREAEYPAAL